jgi:hypothetical protein
LQLPVAIMVRLLRRWGLNQPVPPPQAQQDDFLDVAYDALVYATERGSTQDVVDLLVDMAG